MTDDAACQATLKEVAEGILLLNFEDCREMCSTFLRFQEYYESPEFAGKVFTLDEFREWYQDGEEEFTYYEDWGGFNIPSWVLDPFLEGKFDPLSKEEKWFLSFFQRKKQDDGKFYIIGTTGENGGSAFQHETAHGLFYVNPSYKEEVQEALKGLSKKTIKEIKKILSEDYHENSLEDEIHAYTMEELECLDVEVTEKVEQVSAKLKKIYAKYWKKAKYDREKESCKDKDKKTAV